jgi:hypothetical protein
VIPTLEIRVRVWSPAGRPLEVVSAEFSTLKV